MFDPVFVVDGSVDIYPSILVQPRDRRLLIQCLQSLDSCSISQIIHGALKIESVTSTASINRVGRIRMAAISFWQSCRRTLFFHYILFTATLGPLLFGFHLVSCLIKLEQSNNLRLNSMHHQKSLHVKENPFDNHQNFHNVFQCHL